MKCDETLSMTYCVKTSEKSTGLSRRNKKLKLVGVTGFEPATTCTPSVYMYFQTTRRYS